MAVRFETGTPGPAIELMDHLHTAACTLSVFTPGTAFLSDAAEAAARRRKFNDDVTALVAEHPQRFGFLTSLPMPEVSEAATGPPAHSTTWPPTASSCSPTHAGTT